MLLLLLRRRRQWWRQQRHLPVLLQLPAVCHDS
jgi:hypothetical protein